MRQQAAAGGQPRLGVSNGPLAEPSLNPASLSRTSPLNHTAIRPPCVTQPTANGSCSSSPSAGLPGHLDKNHTPGLGGGGASNGNVPYPQQNSLPHNCTAASHPSTSSTTSSPSHSDETWRSQQRNTNTQVSNRPPEDHRSIRLFYFLLKVFIFCNSEWVFLFVLSPGASKRSRFSFGRSQWRTPFLLLLLLPSHLVLFLWHSESGRTFLWALHCLLLGLLLIPYFPPVHAQPPFLTPPLCYYLRGPHQRCHAFRGKQRQQRWSCCFAIRSRGHCQAFSRDTFESRLHPRAGID